MARYHMIVLSRPVAGREQDFDSWYTNQHIRDLVKVPGVISARRFRAVEKHTRGVPQPFLAEYEIETDDIDAVMASINQRIGTDQMPMTDAFDGASAAVLLVEAITEKVEAAG
jgi:hypothetical protein